jgi:hypothetical protein
MFLDERFFPNYAVMNVAHAAGAVAPVMTNRQGTIPEGAWTYSAPGLYLYTVATGPFISGKTFFASMNGDDDVTGNPDSPPFSFLGLRVSATVVSLSMIDAGNTDRSDAVWSGLSFWIVVFK